MLCSFFNELFFPVCVFFLFLHLDHVHYIAFIVYKGHHKCPSIPFGMWYFVNETKIMNALPSQMISRVKQVD